MATTDPVVTPLQGGPHQYTTLVDRNGNVLSSIPVTGSFSFSDPAEAATGAAVPASALYIGGNKGGFLTGMLLDNNGFLQVSTASLIRAAILQGKAFAATTGNFAGAASSQYPLSIFNVNTNAFNVLIYSIIIRTATTLTNVEMKLTTADPAYGTSPTYQNLKAGGGASQLSASAVSYTTVSQTAPTAPFVQESIVSSNTMQELLTNDTAILLPAGASNGLTIWTEPSGTNSNAISIKWIEL